jgi:hypothetical protein
MPGCILRHDAEADKITALRRAIRYCGAHHAPDVPAGIDDAGELREVDGLEVRTYPTPSDIERVSRKKHRSALGAQFGPVATAICDMQGSRALPDRPVNQIPVDMNAVPVGERGPGFLERSHNAGVIHPDPYLLQYLPGVQVDLLAIMPVQPHDLPSFF